MHSAGLVRLWLVCFLVQLLCTHCSKLQYSDTVALGVSSVKAASSPETNQLSVLFTLASCTALHAHTHNGSELVQGISGSTCCSHRCKAVSTDVPDAFKCTCIVELCIHVSTSRT